jgi:hypothetical protein
MTTYGIMDKQTFWTKVDGESVILSTVSYCIAGHHMNEIVGPQRGPASTSQIEAQAKSVAKLLEELPPTNGADSQSITREEFRRQHGLDELLPQRKD